MKRLLPLVLLAFAACSSDLEHDGPFDPNAPLEKQAKGEVMGTVALQGETDAAGVNVQLQSSARTYDVDTGADGSFRLTGVVPGTYQLRIGTRYFEEETGSLTMTLGEALDLGTRTLVPRRADVTGSATVEALVDGATETSGGALLTLTKTDSVRSASAAPFLPAEFRVYAADVTQTYSTTSGGDGAFVFPDVEAGVYKLTVETPGAASVTVGDVRVTGEDGAVAVEPVALTQVSGTFAIEATLGDGVTPSLAFSGSTTVGLTFNQLGAETINIGESVDGAAAGCSFTTTIGVTASASFTLGGQGRRYVCVRFVDAEGNRSETVVKSIFVDADAPTGAIAINGGAAYATSGSGILTLAASDLGSGLASVMVTQATGGSCPALGSSEAYTSTRILSVGNGDGTPLTVCAVFGDAAGNWMAAPVSDTIIVDTVAPSSPSVKIENDAIYATSQFVTLTLNATGATEMRIANGSSTSGAGWEPFRTSVAWFLPTGISSKEVTVEFRDAAGNTSATAADTILLDNEAPNSPVLSVTNANAAGYVTSATAQLGLYAVGATKMQLSNDGFFDAEPLDDYATSATFYLAGGDGVKLLYVRYLDDAGNASPVAAASVVLDTELPQTGFMRINDNAAWTTDADVEIDFTATGADEVAIGQGSCPSSGWATYTTPMAHTLTGVDASSITLYARFRDRAGNTTACISDAIGMDRVLQAPLFSAAVTGEEGVPQKTARLYAWVTLSGITADVAEMQVDDDSAFGGAAWRPVVTKFVVPLTKGDGTKTAYIRIRDQAGNTSDASSPWIELDQTGPESPSLVVTDHTGDGFAVTENQVELVWSKPTGVAAFSLERFVLGVDGFFDVVAGAIPGALAKYTDDVTATVGRTHLYRIRALDELGNYSNYSVAVEAYPFSPVRRVFKVNTAQGFRYFFKPNQGTSSLRPTYAYENVDGSQTQVGLMENTVEWTRSLPSADIFEEKLKLRAANQDGSLVYDTIVALDLNLRDKITFANRGWQQRMAVDVTGAVHIVHSNHDGLYYATNKSGAWANTIFSDGAWQGQNRFAAVAVDSAGTPHISYYADRKPRYKTLVGTVWSDEVIDSALDTGVDTDISVDRSGNVYVAYYDSAKKDLKFAVRTASWVTQAVDTVGDVGAFARLAIDGNGKAHIVYYDADNDAVKYATNKMAGWNITTLESGIGGWLINENTVSRGTADIAVGNDGLPRVVYTTGAFLQDVKYAVFNGLLWNTEVALSGGQSSFVGLALDHANNPSIAYFDEITNDLMLAQKKPGWTARPLHSAADPGRYATLAYDAFGDLHLAYSDDQAQAGYMRLVAPRVPTVVDDTGFSGFAGSAAVGSKDDLYTVAWNTTDRTLVFRTNRNGPWQSEVVTTVTNNPSIADRAYVAARQAGFAFVVHRDPDTGGLRGWRRNPTTDAWTTSMIDTTPDAGDYARMVLAPDNTLWVTYRAYNGTDYEVRYSKRGTTGGWSLPATLETFGWSNPGEYPIGFKPDGTVVIQSFNGWYEKAPAASSFTQNTTDYPSFPDVDFLFDKNGKMHAAWRQPAQDLLMYSTNASGVWVDQVASPTGIPDRYTKLQLDENGFAHIVYYDDDYEAVRYATNATGEWIAVTLDSGPKVGTFLSAFTDSRRHAIVFYHDALNGSLKSLYDFSGWIEPESVSLSTPF